MCVFVELILLELVYFSTVLSSVSDTIHHQPDQKVFDIATTKASSTPAESVHVGDSYSKDVVGAAKAGWHPVFVPSAASSVVSSPHSDSSGGSGVEYTQVGDLFGFLAIYGREPKVRVVPTTRPVMENGNDGMATHEWE